jgi:predicted MFS family arabinose efflux permease
MSDTSPAHRHLPVTLVLIAAMMSIITSLGAPLITTVAVKDHVPLSTAEWMLTVTLLTGALATPIMGRLADSRYQHRVIHASLLIVIVGLLVSAVSPNFTTLLIGRSLQGLGLGLVPVCMAIARSHLSPERAGRTIATLSVTVAVGVGLGYPLTSCIAEFVSFHASFVVAAVLVTTTLLVAIRVLPTNADVAHVPFDLVGAVSLTIGLTILLIELGEGQAWGWATPLSLSCAVASVVVLAGWVWFELRTTNPLVDLRQVRIRNVMAADAAGFVISMAFYLFLPILVEFVTIPPSTGFGFGSSVLTSGLLLLPLSVGTFIASRFSPALIKKVGLRAIMPVGILFFVAGSLGFVAFHAHLYEAFAVSGLVGLGAGITFAAMPGFIVRSVPAADTGAALGFYQLIRNIGLSIGAAVSGLLLAHYTPAHQSIPTLNGFLDNMKLAAALLAVAGVVAFVLLSPTKTPPTGAVADSGPSLDSGGRKS